MDGLRFDNLAAILARTQSRRRAVQLLGAVAVGAPAAADAVAAAARHRKRRPTCHDGKRNGLETDKDCGGGTCRRCAIDKRCLVANDCVSGTCTAGRCAACTPKQMCGSDESGACRCDVDEASGEPVCDSAEALGPTVDSCAKCPTGTETCVSVNGLLFNCYIRCGSPA